MTSLPDNVLFEVPGNDGYSPEQEQAATAALGIIEHFEQCAEYLEDFVNTLPPKLQSEGQLHVTKLKNLVSLLDTDAGCLPLTGGKPDGSNVKELRELRSVITRQKCGREIIQMRQRGDTLNDICKTFNISYLTLKRFLNFYDNAKPKDKLTLRRQSVFNTTEQLEELCTNIQRQMARLEGLDDGNHVKYVSEMRQTIELTIKVLDRVSQYNQWRRLAEEIANQLADEYPARRREIMDRFSRLIEEQSGGPRLSSFL
jgi:hypothetical protein